MSATLHSNVVDILANYPHTGWFGLRLEFNIYLHTHKPFNYECVGSGSFADDKIVGFE